MQEVVRKMNTRRAIILLGVAMAVLFLASSLLSTEPSAQTTSPEGKIVYQMQDTEPGEHLYDIWMMDADGTNQTNLTKTPESNETQPTWSSDGTRIAFTGEGSEPNADGDVLLDIWVMDADGSNLTNLTNTPNLSEYQPSWAPSSTELVFVRDVPGQVISEQPDIFVMDANGQTPASNLTNTD